MLRYIGSRVVISLITIWILMTMTFFLVRALPGDPFTSEKTSPQIRDTMMKYYGLDKPLSVQYMQYIKNFTSGKLGYSMKYKKPYSKSGNRRCIS